MSDYSEHGAQPVEDAAVDDPPTESEVRAAQEREHPDQAATARHGRPGEHLDLGSEHPDGDGGGQAGSMP